jgi:tRNA pseudouridine(38-40) synthase
MTSIFNLGSDVRRHASEPFEPRAVVDSNQIFAHTRACTSDRTATKSKPFDADRYAVRRVALRVAYQGWDFRGVAAQGDTDETIEGELFKALVRVRMIESVKTCNFSRSGRTDKGVSAFEQVFALDLRSQCAPTDDAIGFVRAALSSAAPRQAGRDGLRHDAEPCAAAVDSRHSVGARVARLRCALLDALPHVSVLLFRPQPPRSAPHARGGAPLCRRARFSQFLQGRLWCAVVYAHHHCV